jgi:hypothetical protein
MNEKIKALADECGLTIDSNSPEATWKEIEFFAEQIVQDCVNTLYNNGYDDAAIRLTEYFKQ